MSTKSFKVKNALTISPSDDAGIEAGDLRVDSSDSNNLKFHNGSDEAQIPRIDQLADMEYDNVASGLTATNPQDALDEIQANVDSAQTDVDDHMADATGAHAGSAISSTPAGNLAATNVQAALDELQTDVDTRATSAALTAHIDDTSAAHAASAVSNTPSGNLASTDVQAALNELQTDVDTRATSVALTAHIDDTSAAHAASAVSNTPSGNLAATDVQAALNELQTDVDTRLTAAGAAALTNKSFDADGTGNSITNIENADIKAAAAIALNKLAATTVSRALVSDGSGFVSPATTTATEIDYVNGVTSAIQTQINTKAPTASPTFSGTITTPLTASRALTTGASSELAVSAVTATELGYVSGVTSAIQTQINALSAGSAPVDLLANYSLSCSVGSSALTISLKDAAGNNPSGGSPVTLYFRSATAATGTYSSVTATAATSLVISSGSTLGHSNGTDHYIYVYALNNAGTVELAASSTLFDSGSIVTSTTEGGAGAADSYSVMYSTTGRSNVACRLIGRLKSNQATAGTWASSIAEITLDPPMFGQTVSTGVGVVTKIVSAFITISGGTPSITSQDGNWLTSVTDNNTGDTTLNVRAGVFANAPRVVVAVQNSVASTRFVNVGTVTTTAIPVFTLSSGGAAVDASFMVMAIGS